jgi:ribosomal protein S18 acetylase RimI-like enzyme
MAHPRPPSGRGWQEGEGRLLTTPESNISLVGSEMITYRRMEKELRPQVEVLLAQFLREDEHYLANSDVYGDCGDHGLDHALQMFLEHPELGFVWIGTGDTGPIAVCVVCFAISTSTGTLVAKLDDVYVADNLRKRGIGSELLSSLITELRGLGITRIDTSVHFDNSAAKRYYERNGFKTLDEERLSLLLRD